MPHLRRLTPDDADDLARIESAAWRAAYVGILPARSLRKMNPAALAARWTRRLQRRGELRWGVLLGSQVVGYCTAGFCRDPDMEHGFAGEIFELYVHPRLQGRGLGRELMAKTWSELESKGFRWGVLWVLEANTAAHLFYERCGLRRDGSRERLRHGGRRVWAVRYSCPLNRVDPLAELLALPAASRH